MGQQPCCEREDHCWVTWLHWSLAGIALAVRVEESGIAPLNALDTLLGGLFAMWGQTSETWLVLLLGLKDQHRPLLKFKLSIVDVDAVFLVLFKVWIFIMTSPFLWASNLFLGLQIQQAFQVQAITHCCWRFGAPRSPQPKVRSHPNLAPLTEEGFRMACRCWQGVDAERPTTRFQPYLKERAVCPKWVSFLWIIVYILIQSVGLSFWPWSSLQRGDVLTTNQDGLVSRSWLWAGTPANWETSCDG